MFENLLNKYVVYLFKNAINSFLVHLASDSIFTQTTSNSAEVVQRRHSERHLGLLVTKLVHLEKISPRNKRQQ